MTEESENSILIANLIDGKHYSHCRLCLKYIEDDNFARFQDSVSYSTSSDNALILGDLLHKIVGEEACIEIPGIDAVCSNCLDKSLETLRFLQQYEACTLKLNNVLDSLNSTLSTDLEISSKDQVLYIVCHEQKSNLILVQNKVEKPVQKVLFKCFPCKKTFESVNDLEQHNKGVHDIYTCHKCTYTSNSEQDMVEHNASLEFFKCKECTQFRCTQESLQQHEDASHRMHVCIECGKHVKGLDKLLTHEEKHIQKNVCPKCGKHYTTKEFFLKHVKLCLESRIDPHPMRSRQKKSHICQECGKGYSTPGGLRVHQRFVHGNATPHICNQCGKKFTAPCYLKVHMVTHTKEKKFPCDICEGKFVSKEALLYHRRRHTGEKPYSCMVCNERFVNASARAEHIKFKHVGPTLSCELCSRKFVTKNFLRLHMKKHYDPTNKLYTGRTNIPPNVPGEQNMRVRISD